MSDRKERVRALLQEGDPVAGDPGLSREEVQTMRRAVLTAIPEPGRRGWLVPALAMAAALVLAVVIAFSLWRPVTVVTASKPSPPLPPSPASLAPAPGEGGEREPPSRPRKTTPQVESEQVVLARTERPAAALQTKDTPAAAEGPQQIQFSTPGGTRVIWLLNPATE